MVDVAIIVVINQIDQVQSQRHRTALNYPWLRESRCQEWVVLDVSKIQ
jgi:hypothetical protein